MAVTTKKLSNQDANNATRGAYNDVDMTITTNGFLVGKVGRRIEQAISQTTVPGDTAIITFLEDGVQLYQYTIVYTDDTQETMISAERTA